jgi:hypothetical protein
LGLWSPIRRASTSEEALAQGIGPIASGFLLAVVGAIAIMAYILGISYIYVGQISKAVILLTAMAGCAIIFGLLIPRYIDGLLSPAERTEAPRKERQVRSGLFLAFSWLCFAIAFVTGLRWLFATREPAGLTIAILTALMGLSLILLNRRVSNEL